VRNNAKIEAVRTEIKDLRTDMREIETALRTDMREIETALRTDMREIETALRTDIKLVRGEMRELEQRMTIKLGSMLVVAIGVFAAIVKLV